MWCSPCFYLFFLAIAPVVASGHEHRDSNDAHSFYEEQSPIYKDQYIEEGSTIGCAHCTKDGACDECKRSGRRHNRIKTWR